MSDNPVSLRRTLIMAALLSSALVVLCGGIAVYVLSDPDIKKAYILPDVALEIKRDYVDPLSLNQLVETGTRGMFDHLDRYSYFMDRSQFQQMDEELSGSYVGIGVTVTPDTAGLLILSVREGGPAAEAGILSGDVIIQADSTKLSGEDIDLAAPRLRGKEGSRVRLKLLRFPSPDTLTVEVTRRQLNFQHVSYAGYTPDSMIYIRLLDFEAGASEEVEAAFDSLADKNGASPRGVILDLRGNPGGLFEEARHTANLFLDDGTFIVGTAGRSYWTSRKYYATGPDITDGLPMAILVDNGSASSAEIVSGSLQQNHRAILVGDTTFGKGLVQGFTRFPDGSGTRLTISRYYLPGGLFLNRFDSTLHDTGRGLVPDYFVDLPERQPFIRALEGSLLMQQFAGLHQDELIAGSPNLEADKSWPELLADYCSVEKFKYDAPIVQSARQLLATVRQAKASEVIFRGAQNILETASRRQKNLFIKYGDYISSRLRQFAFERKYGTSRAYAEVVVPERPDIRLAARLLREEH
jgi:carboxyl-terminal processing protease